MTGHCFVRRLIVSAGSTMNKIKTQLFDSFPDIDKVLYRKVSGFSQNFDKRTQQCYANFRIPVTKVVSLIYFMRETAFIL